MTMLTLTFTGRKWWALRIDIWESLPFFSLVSSPTINVSFSFPLSCHFKVWLSLAPRTASSLPASVSELPHLNNSPVHLNTTLCSSKHLEDLVVSLVALNWFLRSFFCVNRKKQEIKFMDARYDSELSLIFVFISRVVHLKSNITFLLVIRCYLPNR